jgi:hypothetical protein
VAKDPKRSMYVKDVDFAMQFGRACMFLRNFINCPTLRDMTDCKKTRKFFMDNSTCHETYGTLMDLRTVWG